MLRGTSTKFDLLLCVTVRAMQTGLQVRKHLQRPGRLELGEGVEVAAVTDSHTDQKRVAEPRQPRD